MRDQLTTPPIVERPPTEPLAPDERPWSGVVTSRESAAHPSLRRVFCALGLAFFLFPAVLYVSGVHGHALVGEQVAPAPSLSQGWGIFDDATHYLTQLLPLRARAVTENGLVASRIFGSRAIYEQNRLGGGLDRALPFGGVSTSKSGYTQTGGASPYHPIVATGRNGWLFLQGELDTVCAPPVTFDTAIQRWLSFVRAIRASGRRVVLLIVPEKSTVYPELLAPGTVSAACALANKQRLWSLIQSTHDPGVVGLLQPLLAAKRRDPSRLLYLPLDSHWNDLGGLLLTEQALQRIGGPVQVQPGDERSGEKRYVGDLTYWEGKPRSGTAPAVAIRRGGDDTIGRAALSLASGATQPVFTHTGGPQVVLPATTLFLHDSFGDAALPILEHYAARLDALSWLSQSQNQLVEEQIRRSNTVILETVERGFVDPAANGMTRAILTPDYVRTLVRQLQAR
jgi:alginate O-acetyltransferase complex protein AlgJ